MTKRADRWEKAADRELVRRQRDAGPLFAPLEERRDPEAVRARAEAMIAAQAAALLDPERAARLEAKGATDRATVAARVSAEELAELDRRRAWCPADAVFTADFWQGVCRRMGLPWVGQAEHEAFWAPINAAVEEHQRRKEANRAAAGEQLALPTGVRIGLPRARIEELSPEEQEALEEAAERAAQELEQEAAIGEAGEHESRAYKFVARDVRR